jgi:hypothetical protein
LPENNENHWILTFRSFGTPLAICNGTAQREVRADLKTFQGETIMAIQKKSLTSNLSPEKKSASTTKSSPKSAAAAAPVALSKNIASRAVVSKSIASRAVLSKKVASRQIANF